MGQNFTTPGHTAVGKNRYKPNERMKWMEIQKSFSKHEMWKAVVIRSFKK